MVDSPTSILQSSIAFLEEYLPEWLQKRETTGDKTPLFILISGPQGSGKSYTAALVYKYLFEKYGETRNIASMSIDDFYLTHDDQLKLSKTFPDNQLLQGRGLPGTHDIPLLARFIEALSKGHKSKISLPTYDKSKFNGEGGRGDAQKEINLPLDIVVMEGWFLGFKPILEPYSHPVLQTTSDMVQVNANLLLYSDLLWDNPKLHSLGIVFDADKIDNVYTWRLQQEHALKASTGHGMTDEEVKKFIDRYIPSYQLYYENLVHGENLGSVATLTLGIDLDRNMKSCKDRCIE